MSLGVRFEVGIEVAVEVTVEVNSIYGQTSDKTEFDGQI